MQTEKKQQQEMHPHFPSGQWEGFYLHFGQKYKKENILNFCDGIVSGHGTDGIGSYTWKGKYDTEDGNCHMTKTYVGAHQVFYSGIVDENGFWGHWKLQFMSDGFHLWPKKAKAKGQFQLTETEEVTRDIPKVGNVVVEDIF